VDEFKLTSKRKQQIAEVFNTDIEIVNILEKVHNELAITEQYLAHVIRAMESYMRKITGNQFFCIFCEPSLDGLGMGSAQYFHEQFFVVHFDRTMAAKDLRVY
jgi:predicted ATPase